MCPFLKENSKLIKAEFCLEKYLDLIAFFSVAISWLLLFNQFGGISKFSNSAAICLQNHIIE
jgi:hypothetical protein